MSRTVLLLRHGKAESEPANDDFNRELKDKGKRRAQRVAIWLQQNNLVPDTVISSPAERALTTAEKCYKAMGQDARRIKKDMRIYQGDAGTLRDVLCEYLHHAGTLMLVGHNPSLEIMFRYVIGESIEYEDDWTFSPGTLAVLNVPDNWDAHKPGSAELQRVIHPSLLPKGFPFPDPHSAELRKRPAYYYRQSSVIPYRFKGKQLQVLVTRSSQNKHWVIPKGIADPGRTLQESAVKEAFEEAGVEGEVGKTALGSYAYEKWGATCEVTVYPLRVTHMLDEQEWQEKHRGRLWLPAEEAVSRVRPQVADMISKFISSLDEH